MNRSILRGQITRAYCKECAMFRVRLITPEPSFHTSFCNCTTYAIFVYLHDCTTSIFRISQMKNGYVYHRKFSWYGVDFYLAVML